MSQTYYEVLDISPAAGPDEIRRAYRAQMKRHHPDIAFEGPFAGNVRAARLNQAFSTLADSERRAAYDARLAESRRDIAPPRWRTPPPTMGHRLFFDRLYRTAFLFVVFLIAGLGSTLYMLQSKAASAQAAAPSSPHVSSGCNPVRDAVCRLRQDHVQRDPAASIFVRENGERAAVNAEPALLSLTGSRAVSRSAR